ncbi:MAG: radical SAM protein, partial [Acidobacteria bacterium]|nr:radical SAM protein [Acidobacteriota bacterium]
MGDKKFEISKNISKIVHFFNEKWDGFKPLFKLFSTETEQLIYDTGTNKILSCEEGVYFFLGAYQRNDFNKALIEMKQKYSDSDVLDNLTIIKDTIETEGILQTDPRKIKMDDELFYRVSDLGKEYLPMITLEVTSRCNLRCMYCIYNEPFKEARDHSPTDMSWNVARKSIDLLACNSKKAGELFITFYGGEPLLNLKVIKKSVAYARESLKERPLNFSITTNCTLVDESTSRFLAENNFSILASIDGPKDIHDNYRVDSNGNGSFDRSMRGLKILVDAFGEEKVSKIALNMVFAPPFSEEKIYRINQFLKDTNYLADLRAGIVYPVAGSIPAKKMETNKGYENDKNLFEWAEEQFLNQYPNGRKKFLS